MKAENVHAILAACLDRPALIDEWRSNPKAMSSVALANGVDLNCFHLERIKAFAGVVTMVRHNQLRAKIPNTFRLLAVLGLDIQVFTDYAPRFVERSKRREFSTEARRSALIDFLEEWLNKKDPSHQLVWDIIRHETTIDLLRAEHASAGTATRREPCAEIDLQSIPIVNGRLRVLQTSCDPMGVIARLGRNPASLSDSVRGDFLFAYRVDPESLDLQVIELDPLTAYILSLVDGERSIGNISVRLGEINGEDLDPDPLLTAMRGARDAGWLSFYLR